VESSAASSRHADAATEIIRRAGGQRRIGATIPDTMALLDSLIRLFIENGYVALFAVLVACGLGVPVPEDVSLVAGGIIAGLGHADLGVMMLVGLAGVLVGDSVVFLVGHHFGQRARKLRWVARVLTPRRYARVQAKFDRYGNRMLFFARFLPGLRTAVFLSAGISHRVSFGASSRSMASPR
jgi:membrane protein DedA with SNARE-associated domain